MQALIERYMKAVHEGDRQTAHEWRKEVKTEIKLDIYKDKFLGMTTELESMRHGHLGCTSVAKHCNELV